MFKNRAPDGKNNLCGKNVASLRQQMSPRVSQEDLAHKLQLLGLDVNKNMIQRVESGQRFVSDIELAALAHILHTSVDNLVKS